MAVRYCEDAHRHRVVSVEDAVNRRRGDLIELSHSIHAEPELAFAEHRSCAKTQALVAERGFEITAAPGGLDTAFRAEFGSGPLVIGICAEYDALPGIGHACGHNIIAASAVGAALALAEVADELGLTVVLLGTPAEEAGGGKVLLLKAGAFDDIAATVMLHPGPIDIARGALAGAVAGRRSRYRGREAHAAVAPYLGVNAADAITVAQVAIGLLRQQLAPGQMAHGIVTDGGQATNVIPGPRRAAVHDARQRRRSRCGTSRTGWPTASWPARWPRAATTRSTETEPPYDELTPDTWLADVFRAEMVRLGRTPVADGRRGVAAAGQHRHGQRHAGDARHPPDRRHRRRRRVGAPAGVRRGGRGPSADKAVVEGAIMLARTVVSLAETPAERDRVLELPAQAGGVMRLADAAERWLAGHYDDLVDVAPAHPRATPSWAARSSPPPSSSPRIWPTPASTRRCCPAGPG